uniref:Uncharacterized protein n=1 Tax=Pyrodinium bahamense TaxID=73915 RepID=A0A7S0FB26_9DINO
MAAAMESTLHSVRHKMLQYRTTRRWVSNVESNEPYPDAGDQEKRESLEVQRRMNSAISRYGAAVLTAFEGLLAAQEVLQEEGLDEVDALAPIADALVKGFRQAQVIVKEMVESMCVPLEVHKKAMDSCIDELAKADKLTAEMRRYSKKVNSLVSDDESEDEGRLMKCAGRSEARLTRNRGKLQSFEKAASIAQASAQNLLNTCMLRKASLDRIACSCIMNTVEALRLAVSQVPAVQGEIIPEDDSKLNGGDFAYGTPSRARSDMESGLLSHISPVTTLLNSSGPKRSSSSSDGHALSSSMVSFFGAFNPFDEDVANSADASGNKTGPDGGDPSNPFDANDDSNPFEGHDDSNPFKENSDLDLIRAGGQNPLLPDTTKEAKKVRRPSCLGPGLAEVQEKTGFASCSTDGKLWCL